MHVVLMHFDRTAMVFSSARLADAAGTGRSLPDRASGVANSRKWRRGKPHACTHFTCPDLQRDSGSSVASRLRSPLFAGHGGRDSGRDRNRS